MAARSAWLVVAALAALAGGGAAAQEGRDALLAQQRELFQRMTEAPTDLDLMFAYAVASIRLEDYEQAISTLERMLIFNPDLPRVKLELAVAYYRIGSWEVARFYFNEALAADPPPEVAERVAPFLAEIETRTAKSSASGFVSLGTVFSTNATLGPTDREVTIGGSGTPLLLDPEVLEREDIGVRLTASATLTNDLGFANEDVWITSATYAGLRYRDVEIGGFDAFEIVTGPRLSLDDRTFGPKARPFVEAGFVRSGDEPLYVTGGGGAEYSDTLSRDLSVLARVSAQHRDFAKENDAFDGLYGFASVGLAWFGVPKTVLRAGVILETDRAEEDFQSNVEAGLRIGAERAIDASGIDPVFARPWRLSAFAQASSRHFDESNERDRSRDVDARVGLRLAAPLDDDWAVAGDASYFERNSDSDDFDLTNFEVGVSVIRSF